MSFHAHSHGDTETCSSLRSSFRQSVDTPDKPYTLKESLSFPDPTRNASNPFMDLHRALTILSTSAGSRVGGSSGPYPPRLPSIRDGLQLMQRARAIRFSRCVPSPPPPPPPGTDGNFPAERVIATPYCDLAVPGALRLTDGPLSGRLFQACDGHARP